MQARRLGGRFRGPTWPIDWVISMVDRDDIVANSLDAINNTGSLEASLSTELFPYLTCTAYGKRYEFVKAIRVLP